MKQQTKLALKVKKSFYRLLFFPENDSPRLVRMRVKKPITKEMQDFEKIKEAEHAIRHPIMCKYSTLADETYRVPNDTATKCYFPSMTEGYCRKCMSAIG